MKFTLIALCIIISNQIIAQKQTNQTTTDSLELSSSGGGGMCSDFSSNYFYATGQVLSHVSCNGASDGIAIINAYGMFSCPVITEFTWSNGITTSGVNTYTGLDLDAGAHQITVTWRCGTYACYNYITLTITEPPVLVTSITDHHNNTATANATGGTAPYTYNWDVRLGNQTTATATGLTDNITYSVTITDANGCFSVSSITTASAADHVSIDNIATLTKLNVFPNPTTANVLIDLDLTQEQEVAIRILNINSQTVLEKNIGTIKNQRIELSTTDLAAGVYMIQFFIGNEMTTKKLIVDKR